MKGQDILAQEQKIKELFKRSKVFKDDPEMLSHWAKYICVLTSGFIENAVKHYFSEFASKKAHPYVANYVTSILKDFKNPKMEKILLITGEFCVEWKDQLDKQVDDIRKNAIDSIVANRNNIAHGKSVGLTFMQMSKYFEKALEVLGFLQKQCDC